MRQFLPYQKSYSLHKPARHPFKGKPTSLNGIDPQSEADLPDMQALSLFSKRQKFIMTVIDIFSKRALAIPIKN